ncbi:MAG TPA: hydroxypyruvate isomerase, partial [Candidatus Latescibacteria bacterium]|nr:hydroxypyruvate isomerase [Candidatus Latescibacterota bacterium]
MARISVCIEILFTDLPYVDCVKKVAEIGFPAIEFWFLGRRMDASDFDQGVRDFEAIAEVCRVSGVEVSDFVLNSPDGSIGGSLVNPEDRKDYLNRLEKLIPLAHRLGCNRMITCTGNQVQGLSRQDQHTSIVDGLGEAAKIAEKEGITLLLEPLNTLVDHKGYYLDSSAEGIQIIKEVAHKNVRLLYDIYHMQVMEGNIISTIEDNIELIGHFHSAGVPGRHELMKGELNYPNIIRRIDELGYKGYFG